MTRRSRWRRAAGAGLLGLALAGPMAAPTAAQMPMGGPPPEAREHMEMLRMWRLVDHLELDEAQAAKVFPAYRRQREARQALARERREVLNALRAQLQQGADDDQLRAAMAAVRGVEQRILEAEVSFRDELAGMLTVPQQARLLLFEDTFRSDLRDMVRRMRGGPPGGPPGGPTDEGPEGPEGPAGEWPRPE